MTRKVFGLPKAVFVSVVLGVLLFAGLGFYGFVNGTRNTGIGYETALSARYESNQNDLSAYVTSFYEQLQIADRKSAKLDTILSNAVQGRYGEEGFKGGGQFFSAVVEAYPDLSTNLDLYDKVANHVSAGRESFKNKQDQLLDQVRVYRTWLQQGLVRQMVVQNVLGFPTDGLVARVGGRVVAVGPDALEKMQDIVLTGQAVDAFNTGRQEPLSVNR